MEITLKTKAVRLVLDSKRFDSESFESLSYSTLFYSLLINHHPTVTKDIGRVRNKLSLRIVPYPQKRELFEIYKLDHSLDKKTRDSLQEEVSSLLKKYRLTENWEFVFKTKILTDVLPIPYDNGKIVWHEPIRQRKRRRVKGLAELLSLDVVMKKRYLAKAKFPAIHIRERLDSKNQLIRWVRDHWETLIKPEVSKLPKRIKEQADIDRLAIGLWFRSLRGDGKTWKEIDKYVTALEDKDPDFFGKKGKHTPDVIGKGSDYVYSAEETLRSFYHF